MNFSFLNFNFPLSGRPCRYNFRYTTTFWDKIFVSGYDFHFTVTLCVALVNIVVDVL